MKPLNTRGWYDLTVPNSERREEVGRHFLEEVLYG